MGRKHFLGYTRVSTEEQADKRNGLEAQRAAIDAEVERRGWNRQQVIADGALVPLAGPLLEPAVCDLRPLPCEPALRVVAEWAFACLALIRQGACAGCGGWAAR